MQISEIMQAVATVGFPIVACGAMFWLNYKMNEAHKKEMDKITEAVNNNTVAITNLTSKLDGRLNNG